MEHDEKLMTVETELVILSSRLDEPYRGNVKECIRLLREVRQGLKRDEAED